MPMTVSVCRITNSCHGSGCRTKTKKAITGIENFSARMMVYMQFYWSLWPFMNQAAKYLFLYKDRKYRGAVVPFPYVMRELFVIVAGRMFQHKPSAGFQ